MKRKAPRIITPLVFLITASVIVMLVLFPEKFMGTIKTREIRQTRIISPRLPVVTEDASFIAEQQPRENYLNTRVVLAEGETVISVLNGNFDGGPQEEQIIAYRYIPPPAAMEPARILPSASENGGRIYITYINYDEHTKEYRRVWSAPTAATRPLTLSLYTQDLIGDRSICVLVSGMNDAGEHTLSVFRKAGPGEDTSKAPAFNKIAEFTIDGSISVQETGRPQAYQLGQVRGQSFPIVAYSQDQTSVNILDQLETTYTYNSEKGIYEQSKTVRIPGKELEQRRVREILGGNARVFESFITGLWFYVSPQGTLDSHQYIYFDPSGREIIFYGDETQQIFTWQNSSATRYGLYVSSQNISVTTLRRFLDIELESLDSIRVKVNEDVRLKFGVNAPWDGSYRKAGLPRSLARLEVPVPAPYRDAVYDGSMGRLQFYSNGSYELSSRDSSRQGNYAFFSLNNQEVLELRSTELRSTNPADNSARETYLVEYSKEGSGEGEKLSLRRIRLGARGIQELHEPAISLTGVY